MNISLLAQKERSYNNFNDNFSPLLVAPKKTQSRLHKKENSEKMNQTTTTLDKIFTFNREVET